MSDSDAFGACVTIRKWTVRNNNDGIANEDHNNLYRNHNGP